jgi:tetratricopeptide (TPR) repeat protein
VTQQLRKKGKIFLKRVGGAEGMRQLRQRYDPPEENWWWFIEQYLAAEAKAQRIKTVRTIAVAAVVVAVLMGLYQVFLAPDEITRERIRFEQGAERAITEGDAETALDQVNQALALEPTNPDLLLLKGVTLHALDRTDEAEAAFEAARAEIENPMQFLSARAEVYLRAGMPEEALQDAQTMLELDATSAIGYFQLGSANAALGNLVEASDNYERASELARAEGNTELEGLARVQLANLMMMMMAPQPSAEQGTVTPTP